MKFTERFFEFPVRIWDRFSLEKADKVEELTENPDEGEWREGIMKMPYTDIVSWVDYFDSEYGVDRVDRDGFQATVVLTKNGQACICTLSREEFEKSLDIYVEKYEKWEEQREEEMMKKAQAMMEEIDVKIDHERHTD